MTITFAPTRSGAETPPRAQEPWRPPGLLRGAGVTIGPSIALDALLVASSATTIAGALGAPSRRLPRALRLAAAFGTLAPWAYLLVLRPRVLTWGATDREAAMPLAGDEFIPQPVWTSTRAITIEAPTEAVWPWLAQMGQDRGGLYSYTWLENLAGLEFRNADRIVPEWQRLEAGDFLRLAPGQDTMVLAHLKRGRALVRRIVDPVTHQPADRDNPAACAFADATWAFVLEPLDGKRTRLIQRFRFDARPRRWAGALYTALVEIPHFVMEFGMLRGIKRRAERTWRAQAGP